MLSFNEGTTNYKTHINEKVLFNIIITMKKNKKEKVKSKQKII